MINCNWVIPPPSHLPGHHRIIVNKPLSPRLPHHSHQQTTQTLTSSTCSVQFRPFPSSPPLPFNPLCHIKPCWMGCCAVDDTFGNNLWRPLTLHAILKRLIKANVNGLAEGSAFSWDVLHLHPKLLDLLDHQCHHVLSGRRREMTCSGAILMYGANTLLTHTIITASSIHAFGWQQYKWVVGYVENFVLVMHSFWLAFMGKHWRNQRTIRCNHFCGPSFFQWAQACAWRSSKNRPAFGPCWGQNTGCDCCQGRCSTWFFCSWELCSWLQLAGAAMCMHPFNRSLNGWWWIASQRCTAMWSSSCRTQARGTMPLM